MGTIDCSCGKSIPARPEWAGKKIRCPQCHAILPVPAEGAADAPATAADPAAPPDKPAPPVDLPQTRPCPFCGEAIQAAAKKCRFCGEFLDGSSRPPTRVRRGPAGTDAGGTGVLVVAILGWVVCGILHPVAWAMGQSYERDCRARGVEPSGAGKAGRILGLVGTIIVGIVLVFVVFAAFLGAFNS